MGVLTLLGCLALQSYMLLTGLRCMHDCQAGANGQPSRTSVSGCCRAAAAAGTAGQSCQLASSQMCAQSRRPGCVLNDSSGCKLLLRVTLLERLIAAARQS